MLKIRALYKNRAGPTEGLFSALPGVLCRKYQIVLAGTTDEWVKEHLALCDTSAGS